MMADLSTAVARQQALGLFESGMVDAALDLGERVLTHNRKDAELLFMLGRAARQAKRYAQSASYLQKCQSLAPRDPAVYTELGLLRFNQGRFSECLNLYDKALKFQPGFPPALAAKAGLHEQQGEYGKAAELLKPFIEAGTEDDAAAVVYARVLHQRGEFLQVIDFAQRHLSKPATLPLNRMHLLDSCGKAHDRLGQIDRAFEAFAQSRAIQAQRFDPHLFAREIDELIEVF